MEIIKGNWYECVNQEGWHEDFILGKKYVSECNGMLIAENKINRTIASYEYSFKLSTNTPAHYDNSNGSLYKFCEEQKLNSYEFDLIKRIMRCRKKGQFEADLKSTKVLIDLYLKEYEVQEKSD